MTLISGERLYLRDVTPSDVNDVYYRWMNDPDITRFLESRFHPQSVEGLRDYVVARASDPSSIFLAIVLRESDRHIGNIKVGPIDWNHRTGDIGLLIGERDCWGKGFATEAIGAVTDFSFRVLNLHKVTASSYSNNPASAAAFRKAGFEHEGTRRQQFCCDGAYVDQILFGRVRSSKE